MNYLSGRFLLALIPLSFSLSTHPVKRSGSYPFICGDTFRNFCDHIYDETGANFIPHDVKRGDTIFLNGGTLDRFFKDYHPKIKHPYIIVTHNGDWAVPSKHTKYLDDTKVFTWFGQNIDREHPKLHPIPIGIANPKFKHGKVAILKRAIKKSATFNKRNQGKLIYGNFSVKTNRKVRTPLRDLLQSKPFVFWVPQNRNFGQYLNEMASYRFVASPVGNGVDCHRTWEALYLGCIPIVDNSCITPLFDDLPVIVIDDWDKITPEFLAKEYQKIIKKPVNHQKLYADYWFNRINDMSKECCRVYS